MIMCSPKGQYQRVAVQNGKDLRREGFVLSEGNEKQDAASWCQAGHPCGGKTQVGGWALRLMCTAPCWGVG